MTPLEVKDGGLTGPGDCQVMNDVELYAPDTLDFEQGIPWIFPYSNKISQYCIIGNFVPSFCK